MGFFNDFKKNYNEQMEISKEKAEIKKENYFDKKREKYKEKLNLDVLTDKDIEILQYIDSELSFARANRWGGISSEKDILAGQANLLRVLVNQNWMMLNALKSIEKRLENLENK